MDDEDVLCRFGTPLEPLEEDEVPSKKPISIEDQIVTDVNGRRRFHGAFTGGFSAGFWNTVGSLEGWKPQNFKSSRSEKAKLEAQRPTDFMDDEDLGEFGIAPQRTQTTDEFKRQEDVKTGSSDKIRKRKLQQISSGPIPGVPVLQQLLQPAKENVAIRILQKMGWKHGQGIGARQTRQQKKYTAERNARESYVFKKYGCDMGPISSNQENKNDNQDEESASDISDDDITFAPEDVETLAFSVKDNLFGLGYSGLDRNPVLRKQHIDLFGPFEVIGKGNKKLSIRGQAFGVGALEEEDEDIYARDDMTKYDFSLDDKKKKETKIKQKQEQTVIDGFQAAKQDKLCKEIFIVNLPAGYKPRNWMVRRSRFEPLAEEKAAILQKSEEYKVKGLGRHDLKPEERGKILGETSSKSDKQEVTKKSDKNKSKSKSYIEQVNEKYNKLREAKSDKVLDMITSKFDSFTKGEVINQEPEKTVDPETQKENDKLQKEAEKLTKDLDKTPGVFKPFAGNDAKQGRYDKFIETNLRADEEITKFLATLQPLHMSEWDREMEKKEFLQARKIYKPLQGLMFDRFVSESTVVAEKVLEESINKEDKKIVIKRTKIMWRPASQLCKRFNIAEPFDGGMVELKPKKKSKFSVFDYLETSVNKKSDFVTPVIIPTKAEKPQPIVQQERNESLLEWNEASTSSNNRLSSKDIFQQEFNANQETRSINEVTKNTEEISSSARQQESIEKTRKFQKPKTELEKKCEEMKNKHPSEKKDLFKSIFEDSSEDENEEKTDDNTNKKSEISFAEIHQNATKDIFTILTKPVTEMNILRNTSPPRGIFAGIFGKPPEISEVIETKSSDPIDTVDVNLVKEITKPEERRHEIGGKILFKSRSMRMLNEDVDDNTYGPKIPVVLPSTSEIPSGKKDESKSSSIDDKIVKLLTKTKRHPEIIEEWIEKPKELLDKKKKKKEKDKKKSKSKKHKKEKKKHKDKK